MTLRVGDLCSGGPPRSRQFRLSFLDICNCSSGPLCESVSPTPTRQSTEYRNSRNSKQRIETRRFALWFIALNRIAPTVVCLSWRLLANCLLGAVPVTSWAALSGAMWGHRVKYTPNSLIGPSDNRTIYIEAQKVARVATNGFCLTTHLSQRFKTHKLD